jgi:hypothetical protein
MGSFWDQQKQIPSTKSKQKTKEQRELENGLSRLTKRVSLLARRGFKKKPEQRTIITQKTI